MIENYRTLSNGIVEQIERKPFIYSPEYVHAYDNLDCDKMSELRFNNIVESIGHIPDSLFDFGYGNGAFLLYALQEGVNCFGFDITGERMPNGCGELQHYEMICFFDSLEHTDNISKTIVTLPSHDYVVISVPAFREREFYSDEWFTSWKHRKENEHLWFFPGTALIKFMSQQGYVLVSLNHCEDRIRKSSDGFPNITTGVFKKYRK